MNIENVEQLHEALSKEVGEAEGFIPRVYREWCIENAELVSSLLLRIFFFCETSYLKSVGIKLIGLFLDFVLFQFTWAYWDFF